MLYIIVVIGSLFGGQAQTNMEFVTHEACVNMAVKMSEASGLHHVCRLSGTE